MLEHVSEFHSFTWLNNILLCVHIFSLFFHLLISTWVVFPLGSSAAMDIVYIYIYICLSSYFYYFWSYACAWNAESCGINNSMLNCVNYAILFSTVAVPFDIPISNAQVSLLHISPTLLSCVLFSFGNSHPRECEVVSCGFVCFS